MDWIGCFTLLFNIGMKQSENWIILWNEYWNYTYRCQGRFRLGMRNSLFAISFFLIPKLIWMTMFGFQLFLFPRLEMFIKYNYKGKLLKLNLLDLLVLQKALWNGSFMKNDKGVTMPLWYRLRVNWMCIHRVN